VIVIVLGLAAIMLMLARVIVLGMPIIMMLRMISAHERCLFRR